jgi:hypothetical protein
MFENKKYLPYLLLFLGVLVFIYFLIGSSSKKNETLKREGFLSITWSPETIKNFLNFEQTRNPNLIFDVDLIQQQATEDEVKQLLKTGRWPWSDETKKLYMNAVKDSTLLKTSPEASMEQAQIIYNQNIIRKMISWNAPEGQLLLQGAYYASPDKNQNNGSGTYGVNSGLVSQKSILIRCGMDKNNKVVLQQTEDMGNDGITGVHNKVVTPLDYNKLPSLIKGFRFIKSPCDPCVALNSPPQYTCPFSLTSSAPSPIWESLWGLQNSAANVEQDTNTKLFPLLSQIKNELNVLLPSTGVSKQH